MNAQPVMTASNPVFELNRNTFGKLVLTTADGQRFEGVVPVRAFPIQSPEHGISLVDADGHEVVWIDALTALPQPLQDLIREALQAREFMPEILELRSVTSFSTPCTWHVRTDRGETDFVLRGEEDIRRIGGGNSLLIADSHGIHFFIRDLAALGKSSRKLLDRFL